MPDTVTHVLSVKDLVDQVFVRFDGVAPIRGGEIDLTPIVLAVVETLRDLGFVALEEVVNDG
jgi:hypothetical protein